jgi:hypothetical protein
VKFVGLAGRRVAFLRSCKKMNLRLMALVRALLMLIGFIAT